MFSTAFVWEAFFLCFRSVVNFLVEWRMRLKKRWSEFDSLTLLPALKMEIQLIIPNSYWHFTNLINNIYFILMPFYWLSVQFSLNPLITTISSVNVLTQFNDFIETYCFDVTLNTYVHTLIEHPAYISG